MTAQLDGAVARAAAFLVARQEADGAVRSPTYAAFRDGYALTGLAAMALGMAGERAAFAKASEFLTTLVDEHGALRDVAYPTYAAALAVLVFTLSSDPRHHVVREQLITELRARQLGPENGWTERDASFGGWGYYPRVPKRPEGPIQDDMLSSNLSATLLVVGALAVAGVPPDDPALVRARGFVERCQNVDGGFFFSPAVPDANKAGAISEGLHRSYGSMTADGVRALRQLGGADARIRDADRWLERHFDPARNPGEFAQEVRRASSYYYWAWSAAHAMRAGGATSWAPALATHLLAGQRADGSWRNGATEMREDDPVVATAFAVAALLVSKSVIAGEYATHARWKRAAPAAEDAGPLVP